MTGCTCMRSLLPLILICLVFSASPAHCTTHVCITAQSYGYDCQEFTVTTEDGYILGLQRIARGREGVGATNEIIPKRPFLLQHGVLMDGFIWVVSPPGEGLAYVLADEGFDVWIANERGTWSSRGHKLLDANVDPAYWSWTWVELSEFDLTANVNFVYDLTGQKVNYIAHSLGTLTALTAFSQHKLVDKVKAAAFLSPIAYLEHVTTAVQLAAKFYGDELISMLGIAEFIPQSAAVDALLRTICMYSGLSCNDLVSVITGNNCCLNTSTVDAFLKYEPQSTSTRNIMHLGQMVRSGALSMYNYGNDSANLKNYGVVEPPAYNLSNIPADLPLFLGYGGMDGISDVEDVGRLIDELKLYHQEGKLTYQLFEDYAHADFVMASNAKERLHRPLLEFFNRNEHFN